MAIKPGIARKSTNRNPPIFSHEFVIQNHADIVSCIAMVFVVGLMLPTTTPVASIFVALHHNITGVEPSQELPRGLPFSYESGWKDWCCVFFYTLICIIMHALLQEYLIEKVSKKLHLSKFKLARFNDSCQLLVFYLMSTIWGLDVIIREGYFSQLSLLWDKFPDHPMIFLHKLFFIIQLAYYFHMLPELYLQKVKKEDQQSKIIHAICSFSFIALAYFLGFQRIALALLTIHYANEVVAHVFHLIDIFDRDEKLTKLHWINHSIFVLTRFGSMVLAILTLHYGMENSTKTKLALAGVIGLQGYLIFSFFNNFLRAKSEKQVEKNQAKKRSALNNASTKVSANNDAKVKKENRKKESDLPEADQNSNHSGRIESKKVK